MNISYNNKTVPVYKINTLVVGSGAAGFAAALNLYDEGVSDVALLCEGINTGTSRNTGSDKQTYYKLGMCGDTCDSPLDMAKDFFLGGAVDGDTAYAEAANSARCFMKLCDLGVKFPTNFMGEYVGYKTDHDTRMRATSVGPLTSKMMTESLEAAVKSRNITICDNMYAAEVLKKDGRAVGLLALDKKKGSSPVIFFCENLILATGGPAGMYYDSVYPECHNGSNGMAFAAGALGKNLTEWQYGLASVSPRWNVSGTYMQVLPTFVSVDSDGVEREFLEDYFKDGGKTLSTVFKKGYEWPFDCNKAKNGSSVIDLLVFYESAILGRRIYLDYRVNPRGVAAIDYQCLDSEAYEYLEGAEACFGTPIERLKHMNMPAYDLYLSKGVDLEKERLEISLCAQHNNGGISTDMWWRTSVEGLFVIGEAAGTHGVKRPGGSALNAGQVGALRAAQYIAHNKKESFVTDEEGEQVVGEALARLERDRAEMLSDETNLTELRLEFTREMSKNAGAIRNIEGISRLVERLEPVIKDFSKYAKISHKEKLYMAMRLRDTLVSMYVYLKAMLDYKKSGGESRGSAIYIDRVYGFESLFDFNEAGAELLSKIQEAELKSDGVEFSWRNVRPLCKGGGVFENVWRDYREGSIFR